MMDAQQLNFLSCDARHVNNTLTEKKYVRTKSGYVLPLGADGKPRLPAVGDHILHSPTIVLDCFGGVSLGALPAMLLGCTHISVELEPRFHEIAKANINLWRQTYSDLPGYGVTSLIQGDSRRLTELVPGEAVCCVSSPPYVQSVHDGNGIDASKLTGNVAGRHSQAFAEGYGTTPGQLGAMPVGCIITSPPYADGRAHQGGADPHPQHLQGGPLRWVASGASAGQLGGMDAVVSSPPFMQADNRGDRTSFDRLQEAVVRDGKGHGGKLGPSIGQDYGTSPGQLGNTTSDTFWEASFQVLSQTYALLRPGGHAIFVCKDYIRNKQRVPFSQQWAALCQQAGFVWLHHHQASLVEQHGTELNLFGGETVRQTERMSFFRRLHTKKYPELAITHEDVLCFVKPGQGDEGIACCVSSPPYAESQQVDNRTTRPSALSSTWAKRFGQITDGTAPGNLGNLPTGTPPQEAP